MADGFPHFPLKTSSVICSGIWLLAKISIRLNCSGSLYVLPDTMKIDLRPHCIHWQQANPTIYWLRFLPSFFFSGRSMEFFVGFKEHFHWCHFPHC
jgi:hypothetical protein